MPSRRTLLTAATGLASAGLAGCAGVLGSEVSRHYVDMLNGTDAAHTFAVRVFDADEAVLFEHEYTLDPKSGDENRVIEGRPARAEVSVDGGEPTVIPWEPEGDTSFVTNHPDGCPDATTTSLTLWYGKAAEATLEPFFGCETVRH